MLRHHHNDQIIITSIIDIIVTIITMKKTQKNTSLPGREDRAKGRDGGRQGCHSWKCFKLKITLSSRRLSWKCSELRIMLPYRRLRSVFIYNQLIQGQGCIIRSILSSRMGAPGVSSEHVENMEMFFCSPSKQAYICCCLNKDIHCMFV